MMWDNMPNMVRDSLFTVGRNNGKTYQYDIRESEKHCGKIRDKNIIYGIKALRKSDGEDLIDVRVYAGKSASASTIYAIVWLHAGEIQGRGIGSASGYGYDKKSGAISSALNDLGVARDVRELADSSRIKEAIELMYSDVFGEDCFITEFYA